MGLGDDLMMGGLWKKHVQTHGRRVVPVGDWSMMWDNLEYICKEEDLYPGEHHDRLPTHPNGLRPYIERWESDRIVFKDFKPEPGEIKFSLKEKMWAEDILGQSQIPQDFVLINPDSKNTTSQGNKEWPFDNWVQLAENLAKDIGVLRIKPKSTVDISGKVEYNKGVVPSSTTIECSNPRLAFCMASYAKCIVTTEGGLHHVAAALSVPAVVLYGNFISPDQTGYASQTNIYTGQPGSPLGSIKNDKRCQDAMESISVATVHSHVEALIKTSKT